MATRQTRLVIKNNTVPSAPFSGATLLKGEAIVNTADGILMFSGITSSSANWTPAGPGGNATFFEVGSNLYDLKIRNQITAYSGVTNLSGKFLSGTTNGFVLADISGIAGVDSYTTGATWNPNVLTLKLNNGKPNVSVNINAFTALTVGNLTVTGTTALSGSAYYYGTVSGTNPNELINLDYFKENEIKPDILKWLIEKFINLDFLPLYLCWFFSILCILYCCTLCSIRFITSESHQLQSSSSIRFLG